MVPIEELLFYALAQPPWSWCNACADELWLRRYNPPDELLNVKLVELSPGWMVVGAGSGGVLIAIWRANGAAPFFALLTYEFAKAFFHHPLPTRAALFGAAEAENVMKSREAIRRCSSLPRLVRTHRPSEVHPARCVSRPDLYTNEVPSCRGDRLPAPPVTGCVTIQGVSRFASSDATA
jgi:hypothetical protein